MIGMNIASLRRRNNLTQEQLAEKLHVSRQTLAKWERGESEPDIRSLCALSSLFQVSMDDLVHYHADDNLGLDIPPKGKHFFGSVTVGERGQIVIPLKARTLFQIEAGDQLLVFGDEEQGLGIVPKRNLFELMQMIFGGQGDS